MKKLVVSALVITLSFLLKSCDTTEPPPPDGNNNLEYNWEIDTLKNPNGYGVVPWACWGSSPQSVWIAGFNLAGQGEIFKWDGNLWSRATPDLGFNYDLAAIIGFSENDVYIAGYKILVDTIQHSESMILHYNGSSLQQETIPMKADALLFIYGNTSSNIWACGKNGSLYNKIGGNWVNIPFDDRKYLGLLSEPPDLGPLYVSPSGEVFLMNKYYEYKVYKDTAMFYFSKYNNGIWKDLDSCRLVNIAGIPTGFNFGNKAMWGLSVNNIYSVGNGGLFRFNGNNWFLTTWDDYLYRDIKGTQENRMFVVGDHGTIRYSAGSSWIRIGDYSSYIVDFYSVMPFKDEIFIGAYQLGVGYVVHGVLKK